MYTLNKMQFWLNACEDAKVRCGDNFDFYHGFALFLVIISVISVIFTTKMVIAKKSTWLQLAIVLVNGCIMYYEWKNCREWWEIILWHVILAIAFSGMQSSDE